MSSIFVGEPADRAFERLYERYLREVYRYVLAMVRNPAEAEDVTQTTFLNAYRALQAGAAPRTPHNWLIAIAHNTCRSSVRRAMRRPHEVPLGEAVEQLAGPEPEQSNVRELLHAIGRLPSNQRSALAMRELEGRTYPEIAESLGVTVPAVEALIARARRTLRTQVGTLRGLTALLFPRSLRNVWENGEAAAGGALGAGVVAKAAALILVGVAGFASVEAGGLRGAGTPRPVPVRLPPSSALFTALSSAPAPPRLVRAPQARAPHARALPSPPGRARAGRAGALPDRQTVGLAPPAAGSAEPAAAAPASLPVQDPVGGAVQQTADTAAATLAASVPQAPAAPVETPALPGAPTPTLPVQPPELPITVPSPPLP